MQQPGASNLCLPPKNRLFFPRRRVSGWRRRRQRGDAARAPRGRRTEFPQFTARRAGTLQRIPPRREPRSSSGGSGEPTNRRTDKAEEPRAGSGLFSQGVGGAPVGVCEGGLSFCFCFFFSLIFIFIFIFFFFLLLPLMSRTHQARVPL